MFTDSVWFYVLLDNVHKITKKVLRTWSRRLGRSNVHSTGKLTHTLSFRLNDTPQTDGDLKNMDRTKIIHYRRSEKSTRGQRNHLYGFNPRKYYISLVGQFSSTHTRRTFSRGETYVIMSENTPIYCPKIDGPPMHVLATKASTTRWSHTCAFVSQIFRKGHVVVILPRQIF